MFTTKNYISSVTSSAGKVNNMVDEAERISINNRCYYHNSDKGLGIDQSWRDIDGCSILTIVCRRDGTYQLISGTSESVVKCFVFIVHVVMKTKLKEAGV